MTDDHLQLQEEWDAQQTLSEELEADLESEKVEKEEIKENHYRERQRSMILVQQIEEHKVQVKSNRAKLLQINQDLEKAKGLGEEGKKEVRRLEKEQTKVTRELRLLNAKL